MSSEGREVLRQCQNTGIDEDCIDGINRLDDGDKERIYNEICDPNLPPSSYNSEMCARMCRENPNIRDNCQKKVRERCGNIPGDDLQEQLRYYPECLPSSDDINIAEVGSAGKNGKSTWTVVGVVLVVVLLIILFMTLGNRGNKETIYRIPEVHQWV